MLENKRCWLNWVSFGLIALMWVTQPKPWPVYLGCMLVNVPFMVSTFVSRKRKD